MMTRQSMARVSSASPEADFAPAIRTHDWEAAPGATARTSTKSGFPGNLERDADEMPLPFPPGRRPKDGFYLPYPREFGESPEGQIESGGNGSKPRKMFNLKFPGSSKKPSRMRLPFQSSTKTPKASQADEDRGFGIFSPSPGQRFGSSITNRMLMQFQKKQSLWRRCLPSKPGPLNGSPSYDYPNRGRRLDEGIDDGFITAVDSPGSGPSLPSSPCHGHRPSSNFSPVVKSSRFMASMLISLCPDDATDSQLEAEDGNSDDYNDEIGIPHSTTPRTKSSSPKAFEIQVDPASQTTTLQEKWMCNCRHRANILQSSVPQSGNKSRSVSRSLHEEFATASSSPSDSRSGKLIQPRSGSTEDSASTLNENSQEDRADAHPVFFEASLNRELLQSKETSKSSLTWKPSSEKNHPNQEPTVDSVEPSDSEYGDEPIFDDDREEYECRQRDTRVFPTGSDRSSSPEFNSLHKTVWTRPNYLTSKGVGEQVPKSKNSVPHSMLGYLSPPRISIEDLEYTSHSDEPKAFARWRSIPESSTLKRSSVEPGGSERKQSPVTVKSVSPLQNQSFQRSTMPGKIRIKDFKEKSSSLRSNPAKTLSDTDESAEDSECSTPSSGYRTPPSISAHMLPNFASPKPASSKLLNPNLHSHRRVNLFVVDQATTLPGPSIQRIMMARSHSVRSSSSRKFSNEELQADTNFRGLSHRSRLAKTSSSSVMNKVALFESKAGVSKSGPLTYTSSQCTQAPTARIACSLHTAVSAGT